MSTTDSDLNIRIAKIRGWKYERVMAGLSGCDESYADKWVDPTGRVYDEPLRWSGSLDLMHELEAELSDEEWMAYVSELIIINNNHMKLRFMIHATAAQKAEAYCRVKEGR